MLTPFWKSSTLGEFTIREARDTMLTYSQLWRCDARRLHCLWPYDKHSRHRYALDWWFCGSDELDRHAHCRCLLLAACGCRALYHLWRYQSYIHYRLREYYRTFRHTQPTDAL